MTEKETVLSVFISTPVVSEPNYRALVPAGAIAAVVDSGDDATCELVFASGARTKLQHSYATIIDAMGGDEVALVEPATLGLRLRPAGQAPALIPPGAIAMVRQNGNDSGGFTEAVLRTGGAVTVGYPWISIYDAYATLAKVKDVAKNPHLP